MLKLFDSRITGVVLTLAVISLMVYAFTKGEWGDFFYSGRVVAFSA